jgi:4-amino-4-deoxy-L-arabinose transferase-like glycosyltransferase
MKVPMILGSSSLRTWIWVAIVVSFLAKLAVGFALRDSFFQRGNSYSPLNLIARNLSEAGEFSIQKGIPSLDYEPLYPIIMACGYRVFGTNWFGITLLQGLFFGLATWLIFLIGAHLMNDLAGFLAATYHSFYPALFLHSLSVIDTTVFVLLLIGMLYLAVVKFNQPDKFWINAALGFTAGLSILFRGSVFFVLPAVLLYVVILQRNDLRRLVRSLLVMFCAALVTIAPWLIRNYRLTQTVVISAHGGFGFWQGNNKKTAYYLKNDISLDRVYQDRPQPVIYQRYPIAVRPPKDAVAVDKLYKSEALTFIKANPEVFLRLALLKFVKFWSWTYNPGSASYAYGDVKLRRVAYFFPFVLLLAALPFGLVRLFRQSRALFVLISGILVFYTFGHMAVMAYSRLRLPLDPLLMILFGLAAASVFSTQAKKREVQAT